MMKKTIVALLFICVSLPLLLAIGVDAGYMERVSEPDMYKIIRREVSAGITAKIAGSSNFRFNFSASTSILFPEKYYRQGEEWVKSDEKASATISMNAGLSLEFDFIRLDSFKIGAYAGFRTDIYPYGYDGRWLRGWLFAGLLFRLPSSPTYTLKVGVQAPNMEVGTYDDSYQYRILAFYASVAFRIDFGSTSDKYVAGASSSSEYYFIDTTEDSGDSSSDGNGTQSDAAVVSGSGYIFL